MSSGCSWDLIHGKWSNSSLLNFLDNLFILSWLQEWYESCTLSDNVDLFLIDFFIELGHSDFEDNICGKCFFCRNDFCARINICLIINWSLESCSALDNEVDSVFFDHSLNSIWSNRYSFLIWVDFFWNTYGDIFGINSKSIRVNSSCWEFWGYEPSINHDLNKFNKTRFIFMENNKLIIKVSLIFIRLK